MPEAAPTLPLPSRLHPPKGSASAIDRCSTDDAARVMTRLLPQAPARAAVLRLLVHAVRVAHAAAPGSWSLTQFPRATRLNVGRLLAIAVYPDQLWFPVLDDTPGGAALEPWRTDEAPFASLPAPHRFVRLPSAEVERFSELPALISPMIEAAAATGRWCPYRASWSAGTIGMLEDFAGTELPRPEWLAELPVSRWWLAPSGGEPGRVPVDREGPGPGDGVILWQPLSGGPRLAGQARVIRVRSGVARISGVAAQSGPVPPTAPGWRELNAHEVRQLISIEDTAPPGFDFLPTEVRRLRQALEQPTVSAELLSQARRAFHERFGPERLAQTQGRDLLELLHGRTAHDSMAYWLEFKDDEGSGTTRYFGSIRGGSSLKFGVFQRAETQQWMTGSAQSMVVLSEAQAVEFAERQRDELLAAHAVIEALPDDPTDPAWADLAARVEAAAPTSHQLAFFHKTLCLWEPDKLDDYHSPAFQGHVLARLGVGVAASSLYQAAAPFVALLQALRHTYPSLDMAQMTLAMNALYGAPIGHWRVGTTAGETDMWPAMRDGGWVGVGWDDLGDLSDVVDGLDGRPAIDAIKARIAEVYPSEVATTRGRSASQLWSFFGRIQEGDLVYAARGAQILGVGHVVGGYRFDGDARPFSHRRAVRWLTTTAFKAPSHAGLLTTVHNLGPALDIQAAAARHVQAAAPVAPTGHVAAPARPARAVGAIEQQLVRKGQVILYGPPGTGKTHHALQAAQDIVAHEAFGRAWPSLSQSEKRLLEGKEGDRQRIWTCTFHPAYSYEDFVEGLRPVVIDGQLSFLPRKGLFRELCDRAARARDQHFVLIIDEFNRGDAPRIFGELLTLLELDKRDKVSVVLPTSGDSLSVPGNIFVIATMNTADRSIALLDAALRRRFGFMELLPDARVLGEVEAAGIRLADLLDVLNRRLLESLGDAARNLQIGHAYLMGPRNVHTLRTAFQYDILPLLQEYCGDDPDQLERLVGPGLYDRQGRQFRREAFASGQEDLFLAALTALDPALLQRREEAPTEDEDRGDHA